jgi:nucleoid-associated protein YgaU
MQKMLVLGLMVAMSLCVGCSKNKTARQVQPVPMPPGSSANANYGDYGNNSTPATAVAPQPMHTEPMSVQGVQNQTSYVASPESPYIELPAVSVTNGNMVEPIEQPIPQDPSTSIAPSTYTFSDQPMESTPTPTYVQPSAPVISEPVPTPASSSSAIHVVAKGETLWRIAKQYYGNGKRWTDIAQANNLSDPNRLYVGMKLTIPR